MANTGYERSLSLSVDRRIAGKSLDGYPVIYQGRNSFTQGGITYPAITVFSMQGMTTVAFNIRLAAFKLYVQSIESGLVIDTNVVIGNEAYRQNLTSCPI